jgi:hypothetical protein
MNRIASYDEFPNGAVQVSEAISPLAKQIASSQSLLRNDITSKRERITRRLEGTKLTKMK